MQILFDASHSASPSARAFMARASLPVQDAVMLETRVLVMRKYTKKRNADGYTVILSVSDPSPSMLLSIFLFKTLLRLYISLFLPHLSYCSSVWSPTKFSGDARFLERVQFFGLKLSFKNWSSNYSALLASSNLPPLSTYHDIVKLTLT